MTNPEPMFTVPLSALAPVGQDWLGEWGWYCNVGPVDEYDSRCCYSSDSTNEAAVAAAVQHLADVHGIRPADGDVETEWRILADDARTGTQVVYWHAPNEERARWAMGADPAEIGSFSNLVLTRRTMYASAWEEVPSE